MTPPPRHWKKLNGICGKTVNRNDPKFCLRDIINLELYKDEFLRKVILQGVIVFLVWARAPNFILGSGLGGYGPI